MVGCLRSNVDIAGGTYDVLLDGRVAIVARGPKREPFVFLLTQADDYGCSPSVLLSFIIAFYAENKEGGGTTDSTEGYEVLE